MLTFLAHLGRGPESPLVLGLFVVIALAGLRFSLGLIGFATVACMLAYLGLVGARDPHWFDSDHAVPPTQQVITLICLALLGIVQGQIARRLKIVAEYYAQRQQIAVSRRKDA